MNWPETHSGPSPMLHVQRGLRARGEERVTALTSQRPPTPPPLTGETGGGRCGPSSPGATRNWACPFQVQTWNRAVVLPTVPTGVMAMAEVTVYVLAPQAVLGCRAMRPPSSQSSWVSWLQPEVGRHPGAGLLAQESFQIMSLTSIPAPVFQT